MYCVNILNHLVQSDLKPIKGLLSQLEQLFDNNVNKSKTLHHHNFNYQKTYQTGILMSTNWKMLTRQD